MPATARWTRDGGARPIPCAIRQASITPRSRWYGATRPRCPDTRRPPGSPIKRQGASLRRAERRLSADSDGNSDETVLCPKRESAAWGEGCRSMDIRRRRSLRTVLAGSLIIGGLTTLSLAATTALTIGTASATPATLFSSTTAGSYAVTVPGGVTSVTIAAVGGTGGTGDGASGGEGQS